MIYETAQNSWIASRKRILKEDTVYSMKITSCCHVLTHTESYTEVWWTLFWYQYISDHTSKSSNMGNLRLQYLPCETSQKRRNGNKNIEYASNKQMIKLQKDVYKYVRWLNKQQTYVWKCDYNWMAIQGYTHYSVSVVDISWYFSEDQYSSWKTKTVCLEVFHTSCNFSAFETMLLPSRKPTWQWKRPASEVSRSTDGKPLNLSEFCASPLPKEVRSLYSRCNNPVCFEGTLLWLLC